MLRALLCAFVGSLVVACGGAAANAPRPASGGEAEEPPAPQAPAQTEGFDKEHAVERCGPQDSYAYVANVTCGDGSKPLEGNPQLAAAARQGNVGPNAKGHIIDLYVVPCSEGVREVYVDLYGCPEWEQKLIPQGGPQGGGGSSI